MTAHIIPTEGPSVQWLAEDGKRRRSGLPRSRSRRGSIRVPVPAASRSRRSPGSPGRETRGRYRSR